MNSLVTNPSFGINKEMFANDKFINIDKSFTPFRESISLMTKEFENILK